MLKQASRRVRGLVLAGTLGALVASPVLALAQAPAPAPVPRLPAGQAQQASQPTIMLTMDQAIDMALRNNLGLEESRLNIDVAAYSITAARSAFLPQVLATLSSGTSTSVPFDFTQGSSDIQSTANSVSGTFQQALPWYGGGYSVSWSASRNTTEGGNSSFNPRLGSQLRVNFSQPLLRGFRTDNARIGLETSERRRAITDIQVEQTVVLTEATVRLAYLNLLGAVENQKVVQGNLDIRQQALENARARVAVGTAPQIDVIQAEADVATNRESVIQAEANTRQAEDQLRTLILDPNRADYWTVGLTPTDQITVEERTIDLDAAIQNALANRLDIEIQRRNLEVTDLTLKVSQNNTLPSVDLNVNYSASGTGGSQLQFGSGFPPAVIGETTRSFGSVLNDTFLGEYPAWTVGVNVGYPIGQTADKANYASAQVQKRQQLLNIRQTELAVVQQVRSAARNVQSAFERIQATQAALAANQQQLDAEMRRAEVGLSTSLEEQIRRQQLAQARLADLRAKIDYATALIIFDRVQRTN